MPTIGTKEAARRLEISQSTVQKMCREGRIAGAEQDHKGSPWHIPEETIERMKNSRK